MESSEKPSIVNRLEIGDIFYFSDESFFAKNPELEHMDSCMFYTYNFTMSRSDSSLAQLTLLAFRMEEGSSLEEINIAVNKNTFVRISVMEEAAKKRLKLQEKADEYFFFKELDRRMGKIFEDASEEGEGEEPKDWEKEDPLDGIDFGEDDD